jgi:transcriptional antiterminator RfaH
MKWHVIHTKVRQEFRALENLQAQGFEVFLPTCQVQKKQQGKIHLANEPLFPRYLFIRLSDVTSNWFPIRSTRGVASLLRFGISTDLVVIPDPIIDCLRQRCTLEEPLHELFRPGEMIEITQGPFKGLIGFFEKLQTLPDGLSRAMLLVELLGSVQKLQIQLPQLRKLGVCCKCDA